MIIDDLVDKFKNIDRTTPKEKLPFGFRQLKKEIFTDGKVVIKFTNYKKNNRIDNYIYENEAYFLKKLQILSFIPRFYGKAEKYDNIYLLFEYFDGNSLDKLSIKEWYMIKKDFQKFKEKLYNILDNLKQHNVIHRDLRPHNLILVKENSSFDIKLIDFQFMIENNQELNIPDISKEHYIKAMKNIGGVWRDKSIDINSFENDKKAIENIINEFEKENIFTFLIKKIKRFING